ncbi:MAG: RNA 2',3'-cyclic phosphodiesterase [Chitinispirillaceae bacterium]|nr:RNA 2',3'-cyclic phosphodiesterase [Chitinispirillaceae bacterium]
MKRLFLAIDLPERIREDISDTYQVIHNARWMSEEQLHITLKFLGELTASQEETLIKAMSTISFSPFSLRLKGVGYFPPRQEPKILWVGIEEEAALFKLYSLIETACVRAGFERDKRKFSPHITVARLNGSSPERVASYLVTNSLFSTESFEVTEFHLYSSHLSKDGAKYLKEVTFPLR